MTAGLTLSIMLSGMKAVDQNVEEQRTRGIIGSSGFFRLASQFSFLSHSPNKNTDSLV